MHCKCLCLLVLRDESSVGNLSGALSMCFYLSISLCPFVFSLFLAVYLSICLDQRCMDALQLTLCNSYMLADCHCLSTDLKMCLPVCLPAQSFLELFSDLSINQVSPSGNPFAYMFLHWCSSHIIFLPLSLSNLVTPSVHPTRIQSLHQSTHQYMHVYPTLYWSIPLSVHLSIHPSFLISFSFSLSSHPPIKQVRLCAGVKLRLIGRGGM